MRGTRGNRAKIDSIWVGVKLIKFILLLETGVGTLKRECSICPPTPPYFNLVFQDGILHGVIMNVLYIAIEFCDLPFFDSGLKQ